MSADKMTTFYEWFENDEAYDRLKIMVWEGPLTFSEVESLMKEAWDARYNTLTYHDL